MGEAIPNFVSSVIASEAKQSRIVLCFAHRPRRKLTLFASSCPARLLALRIYSLQNLAKGGYCLHRLGFAKSFSATLVIPLAFKSRLAAHTPCERGWGGRMQSPPTGRGASGPTKMTERDFPVASRLPRRAFSPPRNDVLGLFGKTFRSYCIDPLVKLILHPHHLQPPTNFSR